MKVECQKCRKEIDYSSVCNNCNQKVSLFSRITFFGSREEHLVTSITSMLGILFGAIFGYLISKGMPHTSNNSMFELVTIIVCANVGLLPGYAVGKTTMILFNSIRSSDALFQYATFIFMGCLHGIIYTATLLKASGFAVSTFSIIFGGSLGALIVLGIIFYIRSNVKNMDHWW